MLNQCLCGMYVDSKISLRNLVQLFLHKSTVTAVNHLSFVEGQSLMNIAHEDYKGNTYIRP